MVKNLPSNSGDVSLISGSEGLLEEEMATHFNILAWEIPWTEEPGGPQSMGHKTVGQKLASKNKRKSHHLVCVFLGSFPSTCIFPFT